MSVIPVLRRMRQENHEFKVSLSYIARICLKKIKKGLYFIQMAISKALLCAPGSISCARETAAISVNILAKRSF
jgi:hypothetical protein